MPRALLMVLLPITFDPKFDKADTTPISNSLRHSLKANVAPLAMINGVVLEDFKAEDLRASMIKAKLMGSSLPLSSGELEYLHKTNNRGMLLQVRITDFTIKMERGLSKPTFTASGSARYWAAPIAAGVKFPSDGAVVSVSVPAKSILMDKATMHKVCGTLSKKIAGELKVSLGLK